MYNVLISVLIKKGILTLNEGEHLAKELDSGVFPQDFTLAYQRVKQIFQDYEVKQEKQKAKKVIANAQKL